MAPVTAFIKWNYSSVATPRETNMYLVAYTIGDKTYWDRAMWLEDKQNLLRMLEHKLTQ